MRGAIPPLPQYACMAWCSVEGTGITLTFTYIENIQGTQNFPAVKVLLIHDAAEGSMVLRYVGILPYHYTVSQPRRPRLESTEYCF